MSYKALGGLRFVPSSTELVRSQRLRNESDAATNGRTLITKTEGDSPVRHRWTSGRNGETERGQSQEKTFQRILHGLPWNRTRSSALRSRWPTDCGQQFCAGHSLSRQVPRSNPGDDLTVCRCFLKFILENARVIFKISHDHISLYDAI